MNKTPTKQGKNSQQKRVEWGCKASSYQREKLNVKLNVYTIQNYPLYPWWSWSLLDGVWVSKTELSGAASLWALICARWNRTSSSTFSLCFFDIRPNFTAEKTLRKNTIIKKKINATIHGEIIHLAETHFRASSICCIENFAFSFWTILTTLIKWK